MICKACRSFKNNSKENKCTIRCVCGNLWSKGKCKETITDLIRIARLIGC